MISRKRRTKRILISVLFVIMIIRVIVEITTITARSGEEQFLSYKKRELVPDKAQATVKAVKTALDSVAKENGIKLKDSVVNIWENRKSQKICGMKYILLTEEGECMVFNVNTRITDNLAFMIMCDVDPENNGYDPIQIAKDSKYYIKNEEILHK